MFGAEKPDAVLAGAMIRFYIARFPGREKEENVNKPRRIIL
jgi:hypothetical protein